MSAPKMQLVRQDASLVGRDDAAAGPSDRGERPAARAGTAGVQRPASEPIGREDNDGQMWRDETARCEEPVQQEPGDGLALCPAWRALLYLVLFYVGAVGLAGYAACHASPGSNFVEPARASTEQAAARAAVSVADQIRAINERLRKIESLVASQRDQGQVARR